MFYNKFVTSFWGVDVGYINKMQLNYLYNKVNSRPQTIRLAASTISLKVEIPYTDALFPLGPYPIAV